ncbi:unnamed protein product [Effrenium voratum]|nr:unnamed protein product [Effrenium voratum]
MDPLPVCKMLCVNQFAGAAYVNDDNCDRCFVGETCSCTVKCEVETVQQSGEKGDKRCGDVPEDPSSFGEPLVCVPRKPPQVPSCETLVDNTFATLITGCKNCKAGTSCRCDVTCREDHKHTGGGEQGAKKCLSEVYECPVRVVWNQRAKRCKDAATSLFVDTFCCPEALDEAVELDDSSACSALTGETECLKGEDQTSKQACCWRNSGFADGNKCAAHGSDAITDATRAHACANRPRILHAHFEELPVCTKKCHDPFQASWAEKLRGGVSLEASDCENCVPGEQDCPCKVVCAAGFIHVGGGREDHGAPRICDAVSKVFPLAPTCMPKPETPKCAVPNSYGQLVQGCKACTPGQPCSCSVSCDRGLDASSGTLGAKACVQRPAQLTPSTCTKLKTRESCLSGLQQQHGAAGQPCCYRKAGFDGLGTGTCAMQGSEEIQLKPDACAVMEVAVFEELPVCVPICMNKFPRIARSYKVEQCDHCLADTACDCKMTCQSGHYFVGGEPEGSRSCTFDNPYLASPPVCEPIEEVECLEPPEESSCRTCTSHIAAAAPQADHAGAAQNAWRITR